MAVNISEVRLLAVPLHSDYKNTAYFGTPDAQATYFAGKIKMSTTNVSYIKDNAFVYPADYDDLQEVNYVMYRNNAYSNKWFYAFITDKERLNDGATRVHIKTDSMQTYLFDYTAGYCFVEREHVEDDTIGAHTVPEGLETGEYICDGRTTNSDLKTMSIIVGSTIDFTDYSGQPGDWNLTKEFKPVYGDVYNGIYSGLKYYALPADGGASWVSAQLKNVAYEGQEDAIHSIFMAPTALLSLNSSDGSLASTVAGSKTPKKLSWTAASKPETLNGYTPKNNKLLTAPYCYLMVDNGGGNAVVYNYEKFTSDDAAFSIYGAIAPGMSVRAVPLNYNGVAENDAEGLNLAKYATCSWTTDAYTAWMAKNSVNNGMTLAAGAAMIIGGVAAASATGGASLLATAGSGITGTALTGGTAAAGAAMIGNSLASTYQAAQMPPQLSGNTNCGDVATSKGDITFRAYKMSIRKEYAEIIDKYFTMYGYKVNCFKYPNSNHRSFFWYTKTIDAVITGDIPQEDLQTIKNCYDRGITFWRNPDNIGRGVFENPIEK